MGAGERGGDGVTSAERLDAWRSFIRAYAVVIDALGRELEAERGMPLPFYDVLVQLSEAAEGRLRMRELAQAVLLSRSGLTRLVDRMEAAGLVSREACPSDRRGAYATVTEAGMQALRDAWPVHRRGVVEHFSRHMDDSEAGLLRAVLGRIAGREQVGRDAVLVLSAAGAGGAPPSASG